MKGSPTAGSPRSWSSSHHAAAARLEEVGEVRERLPGSDRVPARGVLHPAEHRAERADVREHLAVEQDAFVAAQALHDPACLGHDLGRQRRALRVDRERGEDDDVRVAADEERLEEVLDRVAHPRVVLAAVLLGERRVEVLAMEDRVEVVFEQVALHVHDELLAADGALRRLGLGGGLGRDVEPAAGFGRRHLGRRAVRLTGAGIEREQHRRRRAERTQEGPARDPEPGRTLGARLEGAPTGLAHDRRGRHGVVLAVRARAERDRQVGIVHGSRCGRPVRGATRFRPGPRPA